MYGVTIAFSLASVAIPFIFKYYGAQAIIPVILMMWTLIAYDYSASDCPKKNLKTANANGFSTTYVVGTTLFNCATAYFGVWLIYYLFIEGAEIYNVNWITIRNMVISIIVVEICFTFAHKYILHRWFPSLHKLHHYIQSTSCSANYIAGPL